MPRSIEYDPQKFILPAQVAGIDAYTLDEGPAHGVRALCVNTGGGLRYRVLVDRGLDIDQAFFNHLSLTFLSQIRVENLPSPFCATLARLVVKLWKHGDPLSHRVNPYHSRLHPRWRAKRAI